MPISGFSSGPANSRVQESVTVKAASTNTSTAPRLALHTCVQPESGKVIAQCDYLGLGGVRLCLQTLQRDRAVDLPPMVQYKWDMMNHCAFPDEPQKQIPVLCAIG